MIEPIHDLTPRTTATSKLEGRLNLGVGRKKRRSKRKKKRKVLKRIISKYI